MDALALAKRRRRRLHREQGAAMFVVSMTIVALASVGLYALAAAQNEVRTSGNERQSTQTHYLAQYGVIGAAHEMAASKAQLYLGLMLGQPDPLCVSLPWQTPSGPVTGTPTNLINPLSQACRRLGSTELGQGWSVQVGVGADQYQGQVPFKAAPGPLGPAPIKPDFFVELTDPNETGTPPRYATDLHFCFVQLTVTSVGITQPFFPSSPNYTAMFGGQGMETQRARILAGPVQCPR
jgi:hypothetical protein